MARLTCRALLMLAPLIPCAAAIATPPAATTQAEDPSPKKLMLESEEATRRGGFATALAYYHFADAREERLARLLAAWDVAVIRVRDAATARFGKPGAEQAFHEAGLSTREDYKTADEQIDHDRAVLHFKGRPDDRFVRVGGRWKVDITQELNDEETSAGDFSRVLRLDVDAMNQLADDITAGRCPAPTDAATALKKRFDANHSPAK